MAKKRSTKSHKHKDKAGKKIKHPHKMNLLSAIFRKKKLTKNQTYRKKQEIDLKKLQHDVSFLGFKNFLKLDSKNVPAWFYVTSIFVVFLFTSYISIFATLHFEDITNMNIMIVFLFITLVSYFLISAIYFLSENKQWHAVAPLLFFVGIVAIMVYAFKAVDTSDLVRFSIIYTIIVAAVCTYVLAIRR
jgi:hypothetical protein